MSDDKTINTNGRLGQIKPPLSDRMVKVILREVTLDDVNVVKPKVDDFGNQGYNAKIIIQSDDHENMSVIYGALDRVMAWGEKNLFKPPGWSLEAPRSPLKDADADAYTRDTYPHCFYMNAKSRKRVGLVDMECKELYDEKVWKSGVVVNVALIFSAYVIEHEFLQGVSVKLSNIQYVRQGEPYSVEASPFDDFGLPVGKYGYDVEIDE